MRRRRRKRQNSEEGKYPKHIYMHTFLYVFSHIFLLYPKLYLKKKNNFFFYFIKFFPPILISYERKTNVKKKMNLFIYFLFMIEILLQGRTKEEAQRSPVPYGPYEKN